MEIRVKGSQSIVEKPDLFWLSVKAPNTLNLGEMRQQLQVFFYIVPETACPSCNPEVLVEATETGSASSVLNSTHGKSVSLSHWS